MSKIQHKEINSKNLLRTTRDHEIGKHRQSHSIKKRNTIEREEIEPQNWEDQEKSVTLTNGQWNVLTEYLACSIGYRKGEVKYWKCEVEKNSKTGEKEKNAVGWMRFWQRMCGELEIIREKIHKS